LAPRNWEQKYIEVAAEGVLYFSRADEAEFHSLRGERMSVLDPFDLKILRILQRNNLTSQRDIAQQVNLSPAAVHRRIQRLQETGIISRQAAVLVPEKVGRPITLIVEVSVESERIEALSDLKRVFAAAPEVQQCYYVTGDGDFVLIITARDMTEYEQLTQRLFFGQKNVKRFRTSVAMDRVKATLEVPL
jgi:Lrp/AsnC family leucine-responsive transcriptional regulator